MKNALKSIGIAVLYFLAYFGLQFIAMLVFGTVGAMQYFSQNAGNIDSAVMTEKITSAMMDKATFIVLISNIITILILFFIWLGGKEKLVSAISLHKVPAKTLALPALLGLAFYIFVSMALSILPLPETLMEQYSLMSDTLINGSILIQVLSVVIIAPVTEELVFRGLILKRLSRGMHPIAAAVISSAIFGVAHGTPVWMVYAFCLGLVFSYICIKYHSVIASMSAHMVFNLFGIIGGNTLKGQDVSDLVLIVLMVIGLAGSVLIIINIARKTPIHKVEGPVLAVTGAEMPEAVIQELQGPMERVLIDNESENI